MASLRKEADRYRTEWRFQVRHNRKPHVIRDCPAAMDRRLDGSVTVGRKMWG